MKILDKLTASSVNSIKIKDEQGRPILYPFSYFGPGYILETKEQEAAYRECLRKAWILCFLAVAVYLVLRFFLGVVGAEIALVIYFIWHFKLTKDFVKTLPRSSRKMNSTDLIFGMKQNSKWALPVLGLGVIFLTFLLALLIRNFEALRTVTSPTILAIAGGIGAFFVILYIYFIWAILLSKKS